MNHNSKEFKRLKKLWYAKLEKSGFEDIESDEDNLKVWSSRWARKRYVADAASRAEYYNMATRFLIDYNFDDEIDRIIWEYHSNSISYRDIAKLLKKAKVADLQKTTIYRKVKILAAIMLKTYVKSADTNE